MLFRDSLAVRPSSQCICLNLMSSCLRFAWMCAFQVSRWSKWRSRYLTSVATGMGVLLNVNGGHVFLRVVNVTCTDLAWFTFILHRVYHFAREARWVCRWRVASTGSSLVDNTATSSANVATCKVGQKIWVCTLCWHAPLRREHPDYCTAEVGNSGGNYELPCI